MAGKYDTPLDRRSAFEILKSRAAAAAKAAEELEAQEDDMPAMQREYSAARRYSGSRVGRASSRSTRSRGKSFG